ncbi:hypothetical protein Droror1_Dr00004324 [Drosera rotundifolia]
MPSPTPSSSLIHNSSKPNTPTHIIFHLQSSLPFTSGQHVTGINSRVREEVTPHLSPKPFPSRRPSLFSRLQPPSNHRRLSISSEPDSAKPKPGASRSKLPRGVSRARHQVLAVHRRDATEPDISAIVVCRQAAIKLDVSVVAARCSSKDRGRHQVRRLAARPSSTDRTPTTSVYPYSRTAGLQGPTTQPVGLPSSAAITRSRTPPFSATPELRPAVALLSPVPGELEQVTTAARDIIFPQFVSPPSLHLCPATSRLFSPSRSSS